MLVRILRKGRYSDFSTAPKVGAQVLAAGAEVDFPLWYGESFVESGMAEGVVVEEAVEAVVEVVPPPQPSPKGGGGKAAKPRRGRRVVKKGDAREIEGLTGADPDGLAGARGLTE